MTWRQRMWVGLLAALLSLTVEAVPAAGQQVPSCLNYVHREEAGRVEVDLRPDPVLGTFSTLTMWWFIDEPQARKGFYYWNHVVNGRTTTVVNVNDKDDGLHTSLRMFDDRGRRTWGWGDLYTFQAAHYSPETNTTYVAAYNQCRITPRT